MTCHDTHEVKLGGDNHYPRRVIYVHAPTFMDAWRQGKEYLTIRFGLPIRQIDSIPIFVRALPPKPGSFCDMVKKYGYWNPELERYLNYARQCRARYNYKKRMGSSLEELERLDNYCTWGREQ